MTKIVSVPATPVDITHFSDRQNSTISQSIKDKKGRRCGLIQAIRIDPIEHNDYLSDFKYEITNPYVLIVHSKVRPNCGDKFNLEKAKEINISKAEYMMEYYRGYNKKRKKYISEKPVHDTLKLYDRMYDRASKYFKTLDIRMYHEVFEYVKEESTDFETIISNIKNENYNMEQLKLLFENMVENVDM
jgi:hypothetical protein